METKDVAAVETKNDKKFTKREKSWILYDWANSVYATNIMAAIFPTIFVSIAGQAGDLWWGYGVSISTFIVALLAPILGALADYKGMKKKLFTIFMLIGVVFTALIAATNDWRIMLVAYVLSRIGFSGSCLFYDSFLTDVTTNERMDRVSSWGYAMGYIGGSTIPFVMSIAMLLILGYGSPVAQKFSILITSLWWLAFTIPFLKNVNQTHYIERSGEHTVKETFINIGRTAKEIFTQKGLFLFIIAYFFYIDGVGTIINISTAYGTALGLGTVGMILALLVTQIVAVPCSLIFSRIASKFSTRKALMGAVLVYAAICVVGFYMGFSLEPHQAAYEETYAEDYLSVVEQYSPEALGEGNVTEAYTTAYNAFIKEAKDAFIVNDPAERAEKVAALSLTSDATDEITTNLIAANAAPMMEAANAFIKNSAKVIDDYRGAVRLSTILFWAMATLVGTVQGGIQAVSRSYFGKLVPKERSNEYFGFFDIFGKFASVIGPFLYSTIATWTGRSSYGVLALLCLFIVGFVFLKLAGKDLDALTSTSAAE